MVYFKKDFRLLFVQKTPVQYSPTHSFFSVFHMVSESFTNGNGILQKRILQERPFPCVSLDVCTGMPFSSVGVKFGLGAAPYIFFPRSPYPT